MPTSTVDAIRSRFASFVLQHGITVEDEHSSETLLIRDGYFCGRKFSLGGFSLIWFLEENQIKIANSDGHVELSCPLENFLASEASTRKAA